MRRLFSALALFPGLWLLSLAVCHPSEYDPFATFFAFLGISVAAIVGGYLSLLLYVKPCPICSARVLSIFSTGAAACRKCAPRRTTVLRIVEIAAVCVLLPVVVVLGTYWRFSATTNDPDPIGDASDIGWDKSACATEHISSRSNGKGEVAEARVSICDWGFGIDTGAFYVFVRRAGHANDRSNLVLRFDALNEDTPPPVVEWVTPSRVRIGFAEAVSPVTKQIAQLKGISIEFLPTQPYAAFLYLGRGFYINPPSGSMTTMTFDLLPLPKRPPNRPFKPTGAYSVFGCDGELLDIARPTLDAVEQLREHLEIIRHATGAYPARMEPIAVRGVAYTENTKDATLRPSDIVPRVRIIYHRVTDSYALELHFPDLQPNYKSPTEHYDSDPGQAFVSCNAIHSAITKEATVKAGGFVTSKDRVPPILFTPRLGIYTYKT